MKGRRKQKRVIYVNVRKLTLFCVTVAMCLVAVLSVGLLVRRFMKVTEFSVTGISMYDREMLINASGVKRGDFLYSLDRKAIEERILAECPYLEEVEVKAKFPTTLHINAEGKSGQWYIELSGSRYALDGNLCVIAETTKTEGMTKLILPNLKSVMMGKVPEFGESETERKKTLEVISAIRTTTFKSRLTEVNLSSRWDIRIVADGCFWVYLHDMSDFEAKLKAVESVLNSDRLKGFAGAEIDASDPGSIGVIPIRQTEETGA
ncbi:MAG: FtsQ-type POTRA domain-containing protein [Clostridia bacterium]|nr:FtsQ-type POTRA domain-containing protein [Clostridia bacterium]